MSPRPVSPPAGPAACLQLLTGPAGCGKTYEALARIRAAATAPGPRGRRAAAPGEALLLLPTYAQVKHVKRLALSRWQARGILDDPFTTFTAAGERFLEDFRVRALPSAEERDRLMAEALQRCGEEIFEEIEGRVGFRVRLLRLVKELKQTGLESGAARAALAEAQADPACRLGPNARERLEAFLRVFEAYEVLLTSAGLEDHEDTLRRLSLRLTDRLTDRRAGQAPAQLPRVLVVDGFDDFTRVEEQILYALAEGVADAGGEVVVTLPFDEARPLLFANSAGTRARLLKRGFVERTLSGFRRAGQTGQAGEVGEAGEQVEPLAHIATSLFAAPAVSDASSGKVSGGGRALAGGRAVMSLVAGDAEDEAETVARTLRHVVEREGLAGVRGWRDVGVIVRRVEDHAARFRSAFARLGIPLRIVGHAESLASEPLVRALRGPLAVLAGETQAGVFKAGGLLEWLRWLALAGGDGAGTDGAGGDGAGGDGANPGGVSSVELDAFDMRLRQHGIPADFEAFLERLPAALEPQPRALAALAQRLQGAVGPAALYEGLAVAVLELAPLAQPSGFDSEGRPRDRAHDRRLARAAAARARMGELLAVLRDAAKRTGLGGALGVAQAVRELNDALEQAALRLEDRRLDAVTLMDAEEARFWELPVVIVAGLEEGRFPLRPQEDILLRDADRSALREKHGALRLPLARDREVRERRLFYGAVTRARSRLYLSRRAYNDKGDPKEPSFFLRELEALVEPTVTARARTPGRVVRDKDDCFTPTDWRLFAAGRLSPWALRRQALVPAGGVPEALMLEARMLEERALALALQEALGSRANERVARSRRREADSLWSEAQREQQVLKRFLDCTRQVSVSRLNHAVVCPHRFFLAYVAKIPQDDFTLDGPVFDARQRGSALHYAFELALRNPQDSPAELALAGVQHVKAKGLDARLLQAEIERAVALLRTREQDTAGVLQPWIEGLELDFSKDKAVTLGPADCRFKLGGHIDRIDRGPGPERSNEDGSNERGPGSDWASVIDYKRSATSVDISFKKGRDGVDLQLPLYARALEEMEGVRVVGFEWMTGLTRTRRIIHDADAASLFVGRREKNAPLADEEGAFRTRLEVAEATATDAIRKARQGEHPRAPKDPSQCASCPWTGICRPDVRWLEQEAKRRAEEQAGEQAEEQAGAQAGGGPA